MSSGNDLQEMEVGTTQSKTAVNAGAKAGDSMDTSVSGSYEDLGGPTPENSKPDDNSNMLKTPGASLKQVKDVVNAKAKAADPMPSMKEEEAEVEVEEDQEVVAEGEEEVTSETEELVSEEEIASEEDAVVVEYNIEEDVEALLQGEELSEEFREKAKTIFEAALHSKALEIQTALEDQYAAALEEEINEIKLALTERVDSYLEYVASEWLEENALAVEGGLKTEITESFMDGMKSLFEAHYVSMPEEKYDVLENMVQKLDDMETKLNEQIERNIALNQQLSESSADRIFGQVAEGLAISQKDKFATLAESVEFESEENYRAKLETLKKSYFSEHASAPADETENLTEEADFGVETTGSSTMDAYLRALSNVTKK